MKTYDEALDLISTDESTDQQVTDLTERHRSLHQEVARSDKSYELLQTMLLQATAQGYTTRHLLITVLALGVTIGIEMERQDVGRLANATEEPQS